MKVIVSLTSVPARNETRMGTLLSLLEQTLLPDEIRLYLCHRTSKAPQFNFTPPVQVSTYWTADFGPITKMSPVVDASLPDDTLVVTADDDIYYEPGWLKRLVTAYRCGEEAQGFSGWSAYALVETGQFKMSGVGEPVDVLEGWAGVAYRKNWFRNDLFEVPEEFRFVDDVWISSYLHRRGITRRVIDFPGEYAMRADVDHAGALMPGISDMPDFLETNRRAAAIGFSL